MRSFDILVAEERCWEFKADAMSLKLINSIEKVSFKRPHHILKGFFPFSLAWPHFRLALLSIRSVIPLLHSFTTLSRQTNI